MKKIIISLFLLIFILIGNTTKINSITVSSENAKAKEEENKYAVILQSPEIVLQDSEVELLCKMLWGEARGLSEIEQRACIQVALNMVDMRNSTVKSTVTSGRFTGLKKSLSKTKWEKYIPLVKEELYSYCMSKALGIDNYNNYRVIPSDYCYWMGDGKRNYYCNVYHYGNLEIAKANSWSFND